MEDDRRPNVEGVPIDSLPPTGAEPGGAPGSDRDRELDARTLRAREPASTADAAEEVEHVERAAGEEPGEREA